MPKGDKIGVCPNCGGDIIENDKAYGCANWREADGGCKFTIWKRTGNRDITLDEVKMLIESGETPLLDGFVSKAGKPFSAQIVMVDGKSSLKFPER